jgi:hypothetical protein
VKRREFHHAPRRRGGVAAGGARAAGSPASNRRVAVQSEERERGLCRTVSALHESGRLGRWAQHPFPVRLGRGPQRARACARWRTRRAKRRSHHYVRRPRHPRGTMGRWKLFRTGEANTLTPSTFAVAMASSARPSSFESLASNQTSSTPRSRAPLMSCGRVEIVVGSKREYSPRWYYRPVAACWRRDRCRPCRRPCRQLGWPRSRVAPRGWRGRRT